MARSLLIFLLCGAVGWTAARWRRGDVHQDAMAISHSLGDRPDRERNKLLQTPEDFLKWAKKRGERMTLNGIRYDSTDDLKDWSVDELRAALNQGLRNPALVFYSPERSAMCRLMDEWARRDPDHAWQWIQQLPAGPMRLQMGVQLAQQWPADRAVDGMSMVFESREDFEGPSSYGYGPLLRKTFEFYAQQGPEAVDRLWGRLRQEGMQFPSGMVFPTGFDFAAWARSPEMARSLEQRSSNRSLVDAWMSQSPEGAIRGLVELNREKGAPVSRFLFDGFGYVSTENRDKMLDRARRIAPEIASLPAAERQEAVTGSVQALLREPELIEAFNRALPDAEMRREADRLAFERLLPNNSLLTTLPFLESFSSRADERLDRLDTMLSTDGSMNRSLIRKEEQEAFRNKLREWGASEERIEQTLTKYGAR